MFCEREAALKNETVLCSAECVFWGRENMVKCGQIKKSAAK